MGTVFYAIPAVTALTLSALADVSISAVCLPGGSSSVGSHTLSSVIAQPTRLVSQAVGSARFDPGYLCIEQSDLGRIGDINSDGFVNAIDLAIILADWGTSAIRSDLDRDGIVGGADLASVLGNWG